MQSTTPMRELPSLKRNVKLDIKTWNALRNLKKPNETFNDVILLLLKERTKSIGGDNLKAIKYHRKVLFLESEYQHQHLGVEFEYNDVKNEPSNFTLDLQIKKVFWSRRTKSLSLQGNASNGNSEQPTSSSRVWKMICTSNPSIFFGVDYSRKHFNHVYLNLYLKSVGMVLHKEFKVNTGMVDDHHFENIIHWRKIYYEHSLSEDSFINDIEEPLRLSEEEKMNEKIKESIKKSLSNSIWKMIA